MRTNIPAFRLPAEVLDEEIDYVTRLGVELKLVVARREPARAARRRLRRRVRRQRRAERQEPAACRGATRATAFTSASIGSARSHSGTSSRSASACSSSASATRRWTAAAARCGSARRTSRSSRANRGSSSRRPTGSSRTPRRSASRSSSITRRRSSSSRTASSSACGSTSSSTSSTRAARSSRTKVLREVFLPCDDVVLAIGQENAFPWIERDLGVEFDRHDVPVVDPKTFQSTRPGVFFGGDAAFGPKNIIWAVEHGHQAAISIHKHCEGTSLTERLPRGVNAHDGEDGHPRVELQQRLRARGAAHHAARRLLKRFKKLDIEVELGFSAEQVATEVERCLNCDLQTVFTADLCIECDACIDICPVDCLAIAPNGTEAELSNAARRRARLEFRAAALRFRAAQTDGARDAQRREPLRALRAVRGTLPDGRVGHAEVDRDDSVRERRSTAGKRKSGKAAEKPGKRLRPQDRERQRHGLRERQLAADEGRLPHGRARQRQELLPVEHSRPADLVRDPRQQGRLSRALRVPSTSWSR